MATYYSPKIVTNGLVLALDAGNIKSYRSGSTSWFDLSGSTTTGSLVNGPTFNSGNGGSIVFDGTNDRVLISSAIDTNSSFTLEFWAMRTNDSSAGTLISGNAANSYFVIRMLSNAVSLVKSFVAELGNFGASSATVINTINQVVITRFGTTYTCYTNGIFRGTLTINQTYSTALPALGIYDAGNNEPLAGRIYKFSHYNRALSSVEVLQNYNASKTRFGL
jgi:hypothetical protein